jgi:hypothetical protein
VYFGVDCKCISSQASDILRLGHILRYVLLLSSKFESNVEVFPKRPAVLGGIQGCFKKVGVHSCVMTSSRPMLESKKKVNAARGEFYDSFEGVF